MIEEALVAHARADTTLQSLLLDDNVFRMYPLVIPQKERGRVQMPCAVYAQTGENLSKTYCGTVKVAEAIISLDCYGATMKSARQLNDAFRAALLDFRGRMGSVVVRDVTLISSLALLDQDPGLMRVADSYSVWYEKE